MCDSSADSAVETPHSVEPCHELGGRGGQPGSPNLPWNKISGDARLSFLSPMGSWPCGDTFFALTIWRTLEKLVYLDEGLRPEHCYVLQTKRTTSNRSKPWCHSCLSRCSDS